MFNKGDWFRSFGTTGFYCGIWTIHEKYETRGGKWMYLMIHDTSERTWLLDEAELAARVQN
jgi:hypothetical protein